MAVLSIDWAREKGRRKENQRLLSSSLSLALSLPGIQSYTRQRSQSKSQLQSFKKALQILLLFRIPNSHCRFYISRGDSKHLGFIRWNLSIDEARVWYFSCESCDEVGRALMRRHRMESLNRWISLCCWNWKLHKAAIEIEIEISAPILQKKLSKLAWILHLRTNPYCKF